MPIKITEDMKTRLETAIESLKTVTAAYVDTEGKPHISFYGSTHVHSESQLAIWVRKPDSALLKTIPDRPHIAIIYGDIQNRVYFTFAGQCRVTTNESERDRIYNEMHEIERMFDAEKKGIAVIIDLDKVTSLTKEGKSEMVR